MRWFGKLLFVAFLCTQTSALYAQSGRGALVETQIAEERVQPNTSSIQGWVVAGIPLAVTASFAGRIILEDFKIGQTVSSGDVIANLDRDGLDHQIALLEAQQKETANRLQEVSENILFEAELTSISGEQVSLLKGKADRAAELAKRNAISREAAENAKSSYLNAKQQAVTRAKSMAALNFSKTQLELAQQRTALQIARLKDEIKDAVLTSPVDGQIVSLFAQRQGYARQGDVIAAFRTAEDYEIEADVPTRYLPFLRQATSIAGKTETGRDISMSVRVVLPEENRRTGTRPVRLVTDKALPRGLRSEGAQIEVSVPISQAVPSVVISQDAIVPVSGGHVVFVFDEGVARRQVVRLGSPVGESIIIVSGIEAGERIVTRGNEGLNDGDTIREGKAPKRAAPAANASKDAEAAAAAPTEAPTEVAGDAKNWALSWETRRGKTEAKLVLSSGASLYNGEPVNVTRDGDKISFSGELVLPFGIVTLEFKLQETADSLNGKVTLLGLPNGNAPELDVTGIPE